MRQCLKPNWSASSPRIISKRRPIVPDFRFDENFAAHIAKAGGDPLDIVLTPQWYDPVTMPEDTWHPVAGPGEGGLVHLDVGKD